MLAVACTLAGPPGLAAPGAGVGSAAAAPATVLRQAEGVSLEEAVRRVREQSGGRVLRAETRRENGRTVHRIRVLSPDGRVRTWTVDADTGRIS